MSRRAFLLCVLTASAVAVAACTSSSVGPDATLPPATAYIEASAEACPVTRPPDPQFVPRPPYPALPPVTDSFWYGTRSLWTVLPLDGRWSQRGERFWWWSEEFKVADDETPDLVLTARRLDGAAPPYRTTEATNAYHQDFYWSMLVGFTLPSTGCWEITGEYRGHRLVVIQWVP